MKLKIISIVLVLLVLPCIAPAEPNLDLRFKLGNAAEVERLDVFTLKATGSGDTGRNFQLDLALTPLPHAPVSPLFIFGLFNRRHSGTVSVSDVLGSGPTDVDYDATGLCLGIGLSIRASDRFHIETKFEVSGGEGKPDLSTPGREWASAESDSYVAGSFIVGSYYTITEPGVQLGLELGAQTFRGHFKIQDTFGAVPFSSPSAPLDGTVEGSGAIINFVAGFRF